MNVTQRGKLSAEDEKRLRDAQAADEATERVRAEFRRVAVEMMAKSSLREVARLTGKSTNTLQRWKREAAQS